MPLPTFRAPARPHIRRRVAVAAMTAMLIGAATPQWPTPTQSGGGAMPIERSTVSRPNIMTAAALPTYELYSHANPALPEQWLACRPIAYQVNPTLMPTGLLSVIRNTMTSIGAQTGVQFNYAGTTTHTFDASTYSHTTPTIYISFAGAQPVDGITFGWPGTVGIGGPANKWKRVGSSTAESMIYGRVLLYSGFRPIGSYGPGQTWQALITHEVGHALDLNHRSSTADAMYPDLLASAPGRFSAAELRALAAVLRTQHCNYGSFASL